MDLFHGIMTCCGVKGLVYMNIRARESKASYIARIEQAVSHGRTTTLLQKKYTRGFMIVCYLNGSQFTKRNYFIPRILKELGFKLTATTVNPNSGSTIYQFTFSGGSLADEKFERATEIFEGL